MELWVSAARCQLWVPTEGAAFGMHHSAWTFQRIAVDTLSCLAALRVCSQAPHPSRATETLGHHGCPTGGLTQDIGRKAMSWVRGLQPPCAFWGDRG